MTSSTQQYCPSLAEIRDAFADEILTLGGTVHDTYEDASRLYIRAVLADGVEITRGDRVQGGVALRAVGPEVSAHPYTLRQVCTNGAIGAQTIGTQRIERAPWFEWLDGSAGGTEAVIALGKIREGIRRCASPTVFAMSAQEMYRATRIQAEVDGMLTCLRLLTHHRGPQREMILKMILSEFSHAGDESQFGLGNAVTAVARETPDPETRWRLEEIGALLFGSVAGNVHLPVAEASLVLTA